jgi:HNH endonuclease
MLERFMENVNTNGPVPEYAPELGNCWVWKGFCRYDGYGIFFSARYPSRRNYAHRVALELDGVEIPDGMTVDHRCRVRNCVRPSHLEVVSRAENVMRGMSPNVVAGRTNTCLRGHKLSGDNIALHRDRRTGRAGRSCRICQSWWQRVERYKTATWGQLPKTVEEFFAVAPRSRPGGDRQAAIA